MDWCSASLNRILYLAVLCTLLASTHGDGHGDANADAHADAHADVHAHMETVSCTMESYHMCMDHFPAMSAPGNLTAICSHLDQARTCIHSFENCTDGEIMDHMHSDAELVSTYSSVCEPPLPDSVCTSEARDYCITKLSEMASDIHLYCGTLPATRMCLVGILGLCPNNEELKTNIVTEMSLMKAYDGFCPTLESPDQHCPYDELVNCVHNVLPTTVEDSGTMTSATFCLGKHAILECMHQVAPRCTDQSVIDMVEMLSGFISGMQVHLCEPFNSAEMCSQHLGECVGNFSQDGLSDIMDAGSSGDGALVRQRLHEACVNFSQSMTCIHNIECDNAHISAIIDHNIMMLHAWDPHCDLVDPESSCYIDHLDSCVSDLQTMPMTMDVTAANMTHICHDITNVESCVSSYLGNCSHNDSSIVPGLQQIRTMMTNIKEMCAQWDANQGACMTSYQQCADQITALQSMSLETDSATVCSMVHGVQQCFQTVANSCPNMEAVSVGLQAIGLLDTYCKTRYGEDYAHNTGGSHETTTQGHHTGSSDQTTQGHHTGSGDHTTHGDHTGSDDHTTHGDHTGHHESSTHHSDSENQEHNTGSQGSSEETTTEGNGGGHLGPKSFMMSVVALFTWKIFI